MRSHNGLHDKHATSFLSGFMEGLKNGLACQGVISSLMFFIIAMMLLASTPCPPAMLFAFVSFSLFCFVAYAVTYMISFKVYTDKLTAQREAICAEEGSSLDWQVAYEAAVSNGDVEQQKRILLNARRAQERYASDPLQKFDLLYFFEPWRLCFSGLVKAGKTFQEITYDDSGSYNDAERWSIFSIGIVFMATIGACFGYHGVNKMFYEDPKPEKPVRDNLKPVPHHLGFWSGSFDPDIEAVDDVLCYGS